MRLFDRNDLAMALAVLVCLLASAPRAFELRLPTPQLPSFEAIELRLQTLSLRIR